MALTSPKVLDCLTAAVSGVIFTHELKDGSYGLCNLVLASLNQYFVSFANSLMRSAQQFIYILIIVLAVKFN